MSCHEFLSRNSSLATYAKFLMTIPFCMQFNSLKQTIRHFSLIPEGGGGILTHALARVASSIKVNASAIICLTSWALMASI